MGIQKQWNIQSELFCGTKFGYEIWIGMDTWLDGNYSSYKQYFSSTQLAKRKQLTLDLFILSWVASDTNHVCTDSKSHGL